MLSLRKIARLFTIKTRFEAFVIIYALALGATARGAHYLTQYPGWGGKALAIPFEHQRSTTSLLKKVRAQS